MATWAHRLHSHVSKGFAMARLNFGQGVGKGDSYRQSALIPTSDAPDLIIHYSCTQMCTIKIRDSRDDITTQLYNINKSYKYYNTSQGPRGLEYKCSIIDESAEATISQYT